MTQTDGPESRLMILRHAAADFRRVAEAIAATRSPPARLRRFPKGRCRDASFLLARFLDLRHGVVDSRYVCGWRHPRPFESYTHGWLEIGRLVVDVTADQFLEESQPGVIVEPLDASPFHTRWEREPGHPYPTFWRFNDRAAPGFEEAIHLILELAGTLDV